MKNLILKMLVLMALSTSAYAKVYEYTFANRLKLLEDPALAVDYKIELIKKAKHHVHILTFFWDETGVPTRMAKALNEANARGVEVRILTTFMPTVGTDLTGKGRGALNTKSETATFSYLALTPGTKFSLTHSLHEKIFIVDGEVAIIGGRNVSDSSLAGKDMEIQMEGEVVNQVQDHFKVMYDYVVKQKENFYCGKNNDEEDETRADCHEKYSGLKFSKHNLKFFPEQPKYPNGQKARILSHEAVLHQAEKRMNRSERLNQKDDILDTIVKIEFRKLRAYNYFMLPTARYKDFLDKNLAAGNSIEMITNSLESGQFSNNSGYIYALPDSLEFVNQGLKLYGWEQKQKLNYVHEKVLIFDEDHVVIGSHNFGTGSTSVSNEISIEFFSRDIAGRLIEVFDHEISDRKITKIEDASLLEKEMGMFKKKIKFLRSKVVGSLLRELY
jgi:phosphatidylserine/phosphatidylglycerophosphate/cardiolipin synthase-like enzyme